MGMAEEACFLPAILARIRCFFLLKKAVFEYGFSWMLLPDLSSIKLRVTFFPRSLLITNDHRPATRKQNIKISKSTTNKAIALWRAIFIPAQLFSSSFSTIPWICFHARHLYNYLLHLHRYSPRFAGTS